MTVIVVSGMDCSLTHTTLSAADKNMSTAAARPPAPADKNMSTATRARRQEDVLRQHPFVLDPPLVHAIPLLHPPYIRR